MTPITTAEQALAAYQATVDAQRHRLLSSPLAKDQRCREQALYFVQSLQTTGFNMYMAPRPQFPAFYIHSVFSPIERSWGSPSPNYLYRFAFLDGRHTYRVWGNAKGTFWTSFQALRGFWGDEDWRTSLAVLDFDDLPMSPDGDYELFLGPNPPADPGGQTWIRLDPVDTITLNIREAVYDWTNTAPLSMQIEILDRAPDARLHIDEQEFIRRLAKAGRWVQRNANYCLGWARAALTGEHATPMEPSETLDPDLVRDSPRWNSFGETYPPGRSANGGNPQGCFAHMIYDLKPDEALIIEIPRIEARFWDLQLADVWGQTADYTYHRGSLNGHEARADSDGMLRMVLAGADPGVANWIDYGEINRGFALLRRYLATRCDVPVTRLVKLSEVLEVLPADTPLVTPQERFATQEVRRRASLARYGH